MDFYITWVIFQQFSRRDRKLVAFPIIFINSIIHPLLFQNVIEKVNKISLLWSRINAKKWVFVVPYTFHGNVSQFVASLLSIMVTFRVTTTQELVFEAKRVCQRIKHRFVVCISSWWIQNRYKEMDPIRPLFYRYNPCNLHRVTHDNGGWRTLSMVVARERCRV